MQSVGMENLEDISKPQVEAKISDKFNFISHISDGYCISLKSGETEN